MNETRELARFASETTFDDLPKDVVNKLKGYVLDNLGSGLVGAVQPWSKIVAEIVFLMGRNKEASVFGQPRKTDVSRAALCNGAMIGAFELEHIAYAAHPSGTVFPATLAVAEKDHLDGKAFLSALAVGYEVNCRIGQAQTNATESERGFHNPSVNGVFGAAAAAGKLLELSEKTMTNALGIAGSHASGLTEFAWEGAMTKRLHLGRASQMGLESALLAARGFTGPSTVLEGRYGFLNAFSPKPLVQKLTEELGERWFLRDIVIKPYGCHLSAQSVVQRLQEYRKSNGLSIESITKVVVKLNPNFAEGRFANKSPSSILGAQYSIPFTLALAMLDDMSEPSVYSEEALSNPEVKKLASKVEVMADRRFDRFQYDSAAEVLIETRDGKVEKLDVHEFKGSLRQPMSFQDIAGKFQRVTKTLLNAKKGRKIIEMTLDLENITDLSAITGLIRSRESKVVSTG